MDLLSVPIVAITVCAGAVLGAIGLLVLLFFRYFSANSSDKDSEKQEDKV